MKKGHGKKEMNRREFLKTGLAGTATAFAGINCLAGMTELNAESKPFEFPKPVYRTLGRTGLKVTVVSFGAMLTPEPEVIRYAVENGVNYVDTARVYMQGRNEEIVAQALKGLRDRVFLATKTKSRGKGDIIKDVEMSLKALKTDYVDIIQLHNLDSTERIYLHESREALVKLKEQGKVRFFGVTTHKNEDVVLNGLVDDKDKFFDTCLVKYNFQSHKKVKEAIARAAGAGIGIIAMKTQAGGYSTKGLGSMSQHQAALKWVLSDTNVTNAIPGMRDMSHLREDVSVMGMGFNTADRRILEHYGAAIKPYYCHICGECEGACAKGVEISTVNRSIMYADGYRNMELARSTYNGIPTALSASACLDCSGCTAACIKGLDIEAKMEQARKLFA